MSEFAETILVVEDDDALRRLIEQVLVFDGFKVVSASHGAEALRILNTMTPALVVLDLVLPWVNGLEVLATMRATPRLSAIPVVVVTGTPIIERDLGDNGPLRLLRKPVNVEALTPTIQELLARSSWRKAFSAESLHCLVHLVRDVVAPLLAGVREAGGIDAARPGRRHVRDEHDIEIFARRLGILGRQRPPDIVVERASADGREPGGGVGASAGRHGDRNLHRL
jgi:CheY-like chemotaxis protein